MKWEKKGLIFSPDNNIWWQQYYGILPTPIYLTEKYCIRIFFATTCENKFGRITYIDVDENDPSKILYRHNNYILDIGELGAFDDCGVNPTAILKLENDWLLYFAGYQRHHRTPYSIFSGLAISKNGSDFTRFQNLPVLDRTNSELSLRSAPTVILEKGIFKMWYVADFGWKNLDNELFKNKLVPKYCIKYGTSDDGINWHINQKAVIEPRKDEFGLGRPYMNITKNLYQLFYSVRRENISYRIGYAESMDGINWVRRDNEIGIDVSENGWDSEMVCYPAVIKVKNKTFMFYNGNKNGETGFGYAELIE
jgi:predicted GH43/DUF377 family glycosyl hydrolase